MADESVEEERELIRLARQGDPAAQDMIVKKYEGLAYWALPKSKRNDDDERQCALTDAWRAILNYHGSDDNLCAYIIASVRNGFRGRYRHQNTKKRRVPGRMLSLDSVSSQIDSGTSFAERLSVEDLDPSFRREDTSPLEIYEKKDEIKRLMALIQRTGLTSRQEAVLSLRLQGLDSSQISEALGISQPNLVAVLSHTYDKITERARLEGIRISIIEGTHPHYYSWARGDRLRIQRLVFQQLLERSGLPVDRIPRSLLDRYGLYPLRRAPRDRPPPKAIAINRLLMPEQRLPVWRFSNAHKWTDPNSRKSALDAIEYIVMNGAYVLRHGLNERFPFSRYMVEAVFGNNITEANLAFQTERLRLRGIKQRQKLPLLADITDNDSSILGGDYQTARDKIKDHLSKLEDIVTKAKLTERQRKVYALWLEGRDWNDIMTTLSSEFSRTSPTKKRNKAAEEMTFATHKTRVAAIDMYREQFEGGADLQALRKETLAMYHSGKFMRIYDRYFRLRLGILIKEIAKEREWTLEQLPYHATSKTLSRLGTALRGFDRSIRSMVEFALPGLFQEWQFDYKGKWEGSKGRKRAFRAVDYILKKNGRLFLRSEEFATYHLDGMTSAQFDRRLEETNRCYVEEYLRSQLHLGDKKFAEYVKNRKLLALLFDAAGGQQLPEGVRISHKQILSLNRQEIYNAASLSPIQQQEWEERSSHWNYNSVDFRHRDVADSVGRYIDTVEKSFVKTRKSIAEQVALLYSK